MKKKKKKSNIGISFIAFLFLFFLLTCFLTCITGRVQPPNNITNPEDSTANPNDTTNTKDSTTTNLSDSTTTDSNILLPKIDLTHWKVTLPISKPNGSPLEISPPEILDYANNETLKRFMYNDTSDGSLVFYTYPGSTTTNSSYSRTELREQMVSGSNSTNWTFRQGGRIKGTLSVPSISKDDNGNFHRTIVMQIHGRLTNEQRDLIGKSDNDAPPIMKIYWDKGYIRLKSKYLKDKNANYTKILQKSSWGDDDGYNFPNYVGHKKFTLEIIASEGKMQVILNNKQRYVYQSFDMEKWGVFENYFKAGNYLATRDSDAFAKVKYYELTVKH